MSSTATPSAVRLTFIMCLAETLGMTGFAAYTTLLPPLQREWGLSNSEAGSIGGIFYAGYMLAVPLLTSLTDCVDKMRMCGDVPACRRANQAGLDWTWGGHLENVVFIVTRYDK